MLELARGDSLEGRIESGTTERWTESETLHVAAQLARGVAFLHAQQPPVIHRDLKPANILFDEDGCPKLADFGVCRVANSATLTVFAVGTLLFAAPEQLQYSRYDVAVDVWALGCVFACIAHNSNYPYPAFRGDEDVNLVASVARGTLQPSVPPSHVLHAHVRDCAASAAAERPTAASLARDLLERHAEVSKASD